MRTRPPGPQHPRPRRERAGEVVVEVDRVRGDQVVGAGEGRAERLVDVLQPPLLPQEAQAAERDALVRGEPLDGDAQELRRAVDDHHPDLAVEDAQPQAVEEDPRSARVVHQHLALPQIGGELLDRGVEVPVPAVVLDRVVVEPELVDRLLDPLLVGYPLEVGRPGEHEARLGRRVGDRAAERRVRARSSCGDGALRQPAPAARRGDPEVGVGGVRGGDRAPCVLLALAGVDQTEVELGRGLEPEAPERCEERLVTGARRHRHVDPGDRPFEAGRERVREVGHAAEVGRHRARARLVVAGAEVEAELDGRGHDAADAEEPLEDPAPDVRETRRHVAFEHAELEVRVPLQRQLVVGDLLEDPCEVGEHRPLVRGLDHGLVLERDEGAHGRERCRQRDLEPAAARHDAVALERGEDAKRGHGRLGVAELLELEVRAPRRRGGVAGGAGHGTSAAPAAPPRTTTGS